MTVLWLIIFMICTIGTLAYVASSLYHAWTDGAWLARALMAAGFFILCLVSIDALNWAKIF